jgi:hypothetical protein
MIDRFLFLVARVHKGLADTNKTPVVSRAYQIVLPAMARAAPLIRQMGNSLRPQVA